MDEHTYIMVVDDEQAIRVLLERTLEPEGYEVISAADGSSALAMMEKHRPDLVILDIKMPGLNGFQVLERIRQHSNVPVIMLTGIGEVTTICNALSLGADDYVKKPFSTREFLARIRAKLRRAEKTRQLRQLSELPGKDNEINKAMLPEICLFQEVGYEGY